MDTEKIDYEAGDKYQRVDALFRARLFVRFAYGFHSHRGLVRGCGRKTGKTRSVRERFVDIILDVFEGPAV